MKAMKNTLIHLMTLTCVQVLISLPLSLYSQDYPEYEEARRTLDYDENSDLFSLSSLPWPLRSRLKACQGANNLLNCKRSRKCGELVIELKQELEEKLTSSDYSDFGKSM